MSSSASSSSTVNSSSSISTSSPLSSPASASGTVSVPSSSASAANTATLSSSLSDFLSTFGRYLEGHAQSNLSDFSLLVKLNQSASDKYSQLSTQTQQLNTSLQTMIALQTAMAPYLQEIDQLEKHLTILEDSVKQLDSYSKRLEGQFKLLYK